MLARIINWAARTVSAEHLGSMSAHMTGVLEQQEDGKMKFSGPVRGRTPIGSGADVVSKLKLGNVTVLNSLYGHNARNSTV